MTVILLVWLKFEKTGNLFHISMDYAYSCQLNFNTAVNFGLLWTATPNLGSRRETHINSTRPSLARKRQALEILVLYDISISTLRKL
jgi:hypothetical protein